MRRFAIAPERIDGTRVSFDREETHHLARVLRLRPGDEVVVVDGAGASYTVRIETLAQTATGTVIGPGAGAREPSTRVTLIQGIPKGDKMETIVRTATELGVARVLPAITERTVVRLDPARWRERSRRWERVAKEAAKQCGRAVVPDVGSPRPLEEWLKSAGDADLRLCFWEAEQAPLARALSGVTPRAVQVLVGPEGGLARSEVESARELGWRVVGLGPRIVRTETAGPAVLAILGFVFGDLDGN